MTGKYKFLVILLVVGVVIGGIFGLKGRLTQEKSGDLPKLLAAPVPAAGSSQTTVVSSPDGLKTLTMKEEKSTDGTMYTFTISDENGSGDLIFSKTLSDGSSLSIPYNTFSPDDKYIFIKEDDNGMASYIVMTTSGVAIGNNQTLEIVGLFNQKEPNYKVTDVTGWAAPTLIIVNSDKKDGGVGPSFWFEVLDQSFISLSRRFN